ncbi:MAG: hypothetical protein QM527_06400 [Alphaproteobacteria bacterium]|nr:hypothetical protein [Alphaproteobacteria bacterium]
MSTIGWSAQKMTVSIKRFLAKTYPEHSWFFLNQPTIPRIKPRSISLGEAVVRVVAGQMLSSAAATTIYSRICEARDSRHLQGSWLLDQQALRGCGLSRSKADTIINFGKKIGAEVSLLNHWYELPVDDLMAEICSNKGMGEWTAGIIAMFYVGHQDVFPAGDGSLRRAVELLNARANGECVNHRLDSGLARPYRSYLALYLWQGLDSGLLK